MKPPSSPSVKKFRRIVGRKRRGDLPQRDSSGHIIRSSQFSGPVIPPEVLEQRAKFVGDRNVNDAAAGAAIGMCRLHGVYSAEHEDTANRFMKMWLDWSRMLGGHRPVMVGDPKVYVGNSGTLSEAEWQARQQAFFRATDDMMVSCRSAVMALPQCGLAWSMVTSLCADGVAPPRFFSDDGWPFGRQLLRDSLNAIQEAMDRPRCQRVREDMPQTLRTAIERRVQAENRHLLIKTS